MKKRIVIKLSQGRPPGYTQMEMSRPVTGFSH